jgi:hypothetical protein
MLKELEVLSYILQVGEDLFLSGVFAGPVGVFGEAVGVEGGPDVAAAAGVFVVEPAETLVSAYHPIRLCRHFRAVLTMFLLNQRTSR